MKASFLIIASAVLAGCATVEDDDTERIVTYACNYGPDLKVTYGPSMARIESADGTVTMRQRPSSQGFWYESATHSLKGTAEQITYVDRHMAPKLCRAAK